MVRYKRRPRCDLFPSNCSSEHIHFKSSSVTPNTRTMKFSTSFQQLACLLAAGFASGASLAPATNLTTLATAASGINCQGSSQCSSKIGTLSQISSFLQDLDPSRFFTNGEHIACFEDNGAGICAFLQNTGGAPATSIPPLIDALIDHGCKVCGSVPLFFPQGDNNAADHGILTVNFVSSNGGCEGLCS
ncbi:Kp4-domain-containing protein [Ramaria rubella]|nr:Kp4-domain-containing protein [Ramaria rubella]